MSASTRTHKRVYSKLSDPCTYTLRFFLFFQVEQGKKTRELASYEHDDGLANMKLRGMEYKLRNAAAWRVQENARIHSRAACTAAENAFDRNMPAGLAERSSSSFYDYRSAVSMPLDVSSQFAYASSSRFSSVSFVARLHCSSEKRRMDFSCYRTIGASADFIFTTPLLISWQTNT